MKKFYRPLIMTIRYLEVTDVVRTSTKEGENFGFIGGWNWDNFMGA